MYQQLNLIEIFVGLGGLLLIIHGIFLAASLKYYNSLSQTFFIQKISNSERQILNAQIQENNKGSRYIISVFFIFFGVTCIMWAVGIKSSLGWPFNLLF